MHQNGEKNTTYEKWGKYKLATYLKFVFLTASLQI